MDAITVAKWFLSKGDMTPKKLDKLVYYAYVWYLTLENDSEAHLEKKLFEEPILAWVHGPVVYSVYKKYRQYRFYTIPRERVDLSAFDSDTLEILDQVWEDYGGETDMELEILSYNEDPCILARGNADPLINGKATISDQSIFRYYSKEVVEVAG